MLLSILCDVTNYLSFNKLYIFTKIIGLDPSEPWVLTLSKVLGIPYWMARDMFNELESKRLCIAFNPYL